ncbi:MAG TPA: Hsp20/alpha crystallin family protein [Thermomicrobiales bacterium]|nr:Hsp20/alpha crystallin family protein [Thermomicrobiales bacterium]
MLVIQKRSDRSIERIQHEMEDLFHEMVSGGQPIRVRISSASRPAWRPPIEVYETESSLVVLSEIAGLTEAEFEVIVDDSVLTIRGERLPVSCDDRRIVHEMGIRYGTFAADIYLPFTVEHDAVAATYDNGLLRIELPRGVATQVNVSGPGH